MGHPPESLCILRLSSLGDVTHMIPVVHTLRKHWPQTRLTWIIGKDEYPLIQDIEAVEFVVFDKAHTVASFRDIARQFKGRRFDVLLCAQVALRANLLSTLISADLKLGYDPARARDLHTLFIHESITPSPQQHVLDSFFSFIEHLGLSERELIWDYKIPEEACQFAEKHLDRDRVNLIITPCASRPVRNWSAECYAAVADYAIQSLGAQVILCGGRAESEQQAGQAIQTCMKEQAVNLIGQSSLKEFLAVLRGADALISPDSGPAHMATGVGTPVIGLYAVSNPQRSGPYLSRQWCIDKYAEAAQKFRHKPAEQLRWGAKLKHEGVMDLIELPEVIAKLDSLIAER